MKPDIVKKEIIRLIAKKSKPVSISEISQQLSLKKNVRKRLQKWLSELVNDGQLFQNGRSTYSLGSDDDLISGEIDILRGGDGLVLIEGTDKKIRIDQSDLRTAMQGDKVLARRKAIVKRRDDDIPYAKVIRIIERAPHDIVGTLNMRGQLNYVVPLDRKYRNDFFVPDTAGAKQGDRVVVRFISWVDPKLIPEGQIVDVIGPESDASLDTLAIIKQYKLRDEFPEPVIKEAEHVSGYLNQAGNRRDLRGEMIITIDPARARDFDDALSLKHLGGGVARVGIHIADVAHFVREGSRLDSEARERGNSVYFPDKVVPMLPEQLSNGICSLRPDQDRFAFSVFLDIDSKGIVTGRDFTRSIIRSRKRLTYKEALALIKTSSGKVKASQKELWRLLQDLSNCAQKLRKRRFAAGALELDVPESEFEIDDKGMIAAITSVGTDVSHQLVEEFMISANEAVAVKLSETKSAGIYRVHEAPFEDRLDDLAAELDGIGLKPGNLKTQKGLGAFLKSIDGHPLAHYARIAVLKSMNRAMYSPNARIGHYGLAKRHYLHFTSPIRRYPDLVVHRELARILMQKGASQKGSKAAVGDIARHCTLTETAADRAERDVTEIKKYRFLERELASGKPADRDAVIVNVMRFGVFVELIDLQIQGLVHISTLAKGYSQYNHAKGEVRAGRKSYKVGSMIKVRVSKVDFDQRKVDFIPVSGRNSA